MLMLPEEERTHAADNLRLAEQLGAETVTLAGRNIADGILNFAAERNITRIIVGKPRRSLWKSILSRDPVDRLVRMSGEIDVYVITGEQGKQKEPAYVIRPKKIPLADYGAGFLFLIAGDGALLFDVSLLRPEQPHHGVSAGRAADGHQLRPGAGDPYFLPQRADL